LRLRRIAYDIRRITLGRIGRPILADRVNQQRIAVGERKIRRKRRIGGYLIPRFRRGTTIAPDCREGDCDRRDCA